MTTRKPWIGNSYEASGEEMLDFAERYAKLGAAVREQVKDVVKAYMGPSGLSPEMDVNPAAIDMAQKEIGGMNEEIDEALAAYMTMIEKQEAL